MLKVNFNKKSVSVTVKVAGIQKTVTVFKKKK